MSGQPTHSPVISEKQAFAQRLRKAMRAAGFEDKPAVLEREFNMRYWGKPMTLHGVRRWLRGETLPTQEKLRTLSEWLGVPIDRLAYGTTAHKVESGRAHWDPGIGYQDREIFEAFLKLPVPQRKVVREVILAFALAEAAKQDPR